MTAKVLIIGSGGREHTLAWKILQSSNVGKVFVCPGNAGTFNLSKAENIELPINNHNAISNWCIDNSIDLVVIGPEAPLADGLCNNLKSRSILCFGPTKEAAQIESSKLFSKEFMDRHGIPTARWKSFTDADQAIRFIRTSVFNGVVVKASGLAAGKGVIVASSTDEAIKAVQEMIKLKRFGDAGTTVVIEEKLDGEEISVFAFSDGTSTVCFPPAQDFKRAYNGDKGPNTGGMGAYCPVKHVSPDVLSYISTEVLQKTVRGMKADGQPFVGLLYAGLMLTKDGPKVLEYNCRFGDPETQVVLPLLKSDLYVTMRACCEGNLHAVRPSFEVNKVAVAVVLASGGYPASYEKGMVMHGVNDAKSLPNVHVFHAGTKIAANEIQSNGGRVMSIVAVGESILEARTRCYEAVGKVSFNGMFYRDDIAEKATGSKFSASYLDSGVDINAGSALVESIKPLAKSTSRPGCMSELGGFGALFDLCAAGYKDPILVSGTDGVGTKLKVAHACSDHSTVGIDLVAMCVNDILAQGAEPLFFLDYYACGKLDVTVAKQMLTGVAEGCKRAGCALLGGETAEMPGMYDVGIYDIAGFAVGAAERSRILPILGSIHPGDIVIGLASSGIHSNGYSLVRKIVELSGLDYSDQCPFSDKGLTLGQALLVPTKIYVKSVLPLIKDGMVKAFAHITGGGVVENIPRVLPDSVSCTLDANTWEIPPAFCWLSYTGNVTSDEMLRTFNCGLGAVLIVDSKNVESVLATLREAGEIAQQVGVLDHMTPNKPRVEVAGFATSLKQLSMKFHSQERPQELHETLRMNVGVLISGSGTNLQSLIDHSLKPNSKAEIVLVISNVENAFGLERARKAGIPTKVINHKSYKNRLQFDMDVLSALQQAGVELVCLAGFMRILTGHFVNQWPGRLINIHPSLLPSFRGANAHEQVIASGVRITGCTAHFVVEEVDAGGIIAQESVPVLPNDTVESLQERVKLKEWEVFPKAMEMVARKVVTVVDGHVTFSNN